MAEAPVFKIGDEEYLIPSKFRLGDPVLIEELTGLDMETFGSLFDAETGQSSNSKVLLGLVGVAVWQAHPDWSRSRAASFANNIDFEAFSAEVPDSPPDMPAETPEAEDSPSSSEESTTTVDTSLDGVPV